MIVMERNCTPSSTTPSIVDDQSNLHANMLECHICMEPPKDPIATSCGHIFCWPCIYQWLQNEPKPCPVCKNILRSNINILPLYSTGDGGGQTNKKAIEVASNNDIPLRPRNPLLFNGHASTEGSSDESVIQNEMLIVYERTFRRLVRELIHERAHVRNMEDHVNNLEQTNARLERMNADLILQLQEMD